MESQLAGNVFKQDHMYTLLQNIICTHKNLSQIRGTWYVHSVFLQEKLLWISKKKIYRKIVP